MQIDLATAAARLRAAEHVDILLHSHPDGDTIGSGYALAHALQKMGKTTQILCEDPIPQMFHYMQEGICDTEREDGLLVCVDVADSRLLGVNFSEIYGNDVALCIDHHVTNTYFAKETFLDGHAAATAELVNDVIEQLKVPIDRGIAGCLYAGISTDTGCFRYANTTARSHRYAAFYMELGVPTERLDREFFETKTRSCLALERLAFDRLQFFCDGQVALIAVTQKMYEQSGSNEEEYVKLVDKTRQIEGVIVGVSIRERSDGTYKLSVRSHEPVDSGAVCAKMGGGGHIRAAGCASSLSLEATIDRMIQIIEEFLPKSGNL